MIMRSRFFLGEVVDYVLDFDRKYYPEDFTELIPKRLQNTEFTAKNFVSLSKRLDRIRFAKEKELAAMLKDPSKLANAINSRRALPGMQEQKRREIRFLFTVAATLLHW